MSIGYHWSIGKHLFSRVRSSTIRLLFATTLACFLCVLSGIAFIQARTTIHNHLRSLTLSLYINPEVPSEDLQGLTADLQKVGTEIVQNISVISPDSMKIYFNDRFGVNVEEVLPANPFPPVITVTFIPEKITRQGFMAFVEQCTNIDIIDRTVYRTDYARLVFQEQTQFLWITIIVVGVVLVIVSLLLYFVCHSESIFTAQDTHLLQLLGMPRSAIRWSNMARNLLVTAIGIVFGILLSLVVYWYSESSGITNIGNGIVGISLIGGVVTICIICLVSLKTTSYKKS